MCVCVRGGAHVEAPYCSWQQGKEERKGEGEGQTPMEGWTEAGFRRGGGVTRGKNNGKGDSER